VKIKLYRIGQFSRINTQVAVLDQELCQPKKCGLECIIYCPVNKTGGECITQRPEDGKAIISEDLHWLWYMCKEMSF
jgi:ATP-binding cassette subfamily E protein 1